MSSSTFCITIAKSLSSLFVSSNSHRHKDLKRPSEGIKFFLLFVCNGRLILLVLWMVEDGATLMKLLKIKLGDGVWLEIKGGC